MWYSGGGKQEFAAYLLKKQASGLPRTFCPRVGNGQRLRVSNVSYGLITVLE